MKVKVAAYIRYSSDNQTENSVETQRQQIRDFCKYKNYELVKEYIDRAQSGTNAKRLEFQNMLTDAEFPDRQWNIIVVRDFSRFARNEADAFYYTKKLNSLGVHLISVSQDFGSGPESDMIRGFTHVMDAHYSRRLAEVTRAGMRTKAQAGYFLGGQPPLGFKKNADGKLEIEVKGATAVKRIFELYALNYSAKQIVDILNKEGHRTANGNLFKTSSLPSILTQEKYTGTFVWNRCASKNPLTGRRNNNASKPFEQQIRVEGGCPQIISEELFNKVQNMMRSRKRNGTSISTRHHYMLTGIGRLYCKKCGEELVGNPRSTHGRKYLTYSCPNHRKDKCTTKDIPVTDIDNFVLNQLEEDLSNRTDWDKIELDVQDNQSIATLKQRKRGIEKAIDNLTSAIEKVPSEQLFQKLQARLDEQRAVEQQIEECMSNGDSFLSDKQIIAQKVIDYLRESNDPEAKKYLQQTIHSIKIDNEVVEVVMNIE